MCYRPWVLRLVITHTRQGVRFLTGIGLGCASCDITHKTGDTICCGHWVLRLVISHTREEVRVVLYGHWVLDLVILHTKQGVRFVTGIGFCVL